MLVWGITNETEDTVSKAQSRDGRGGLRVKRVGGVRKESWKQWVSWRGI